MVDKTKIVDEIYGIVGVDTPLDPSFTLVIDADNLESRTGYKATDNAFVKLQYLLDVQDDPEVSDADFNILLKRIQQSAISDVMNRVFNKASFIDRNLLYKYAINKVDTEVLPAGFVGYRIQVADEKNICFEIKRILLNFSGAGNVKLLLFNTAKDSPIEEKLITISSTHQEVELNWVIDNSDDYYKGEYYLGYLTQALVVVPFERNYQLSNVRSSITHLSFESVQFTGHATELLPDLEQKEGSSNTWGLNPDFFVRDDFTDLAIQNENIFGQAINVQMQIKILSEYLATKRSNRGQRNAEDASKLVVEIDGQSESTGVPKKGLKKELIGHIFHIQNEMKKLRVGYFGNEIELVTET